MMPRHRKDGGPRHVALRREGASRRGVLPRLPAFGPAFGRDAGWALVPPPRRRLHLARSLLATPWFAAGPGILIAARPAGASPAPLPHRPPLRPRPRPPCATPPGAPPAPPPAPSPR